MPRYFFDVSLDDHRLPDPEGRELPDPDAAWESARRIALDAMSLDGGRPLDGRGCHVEVRDADGEIVLEFPFGEAVPDPGGSLN